MLRSVKDMGVPLALDDFARLFEPSYLRRFPIDVRKIDDPSCRYHHDRDSASIVSAGSAWQKPHLQVVAEGVETREQLAFLQDQSCPEGQGYYFSQPVAAGECGQLLGCGEVDTALAGWTTYA